MSAFLGPIHFWLYRKIMIQQSFTNQLSCELLDLEHKKKLSTMLDQTVGTIPQESLEEQIDTMNIHGWLQDKIRIAEVRLGYVVEEIKKTTGSLVKAQQIALEFGRSLCESNSLTPEEGYKLIEDNLLSGMPCDRVNVILEHDENHLKYQQSIEIHDKFWSQADADIKDYYLLRNKIIEGMLSKCGLTFSVFNNEIYEINVS